MVYQGILEVILILSDVHNVHVNISSASVLLNKSLNCCEEGDVIKSFDRVCEVQSDKATVEITSRYAGTVRIIHHEEGSIVKVKQ